MKTHRIGPLFLLSALVLEGLYFFQSSVDGWLVTAFQNLKQMRVRGFEESALLPVGIYIVFVKLTFLWRIPFFLYVFRLIRAVSLQRGTLNYWIAAAAVFVLPYYLAFFLLPSGGFVQAAGASFAGPWTVFATLVIAAGLGFLYEVFEIREWTDGKVDLPLVYLITVFPYFFADIISEFKHPPLQGLYILYLLSVGFSFSFLVIRKMITGKIR